MAKRIDWKGKRQMTYRDRTFYLCHPKFREMWLTQRSSHLNVHSGGESVRLRHGSANAGYWVLSLLLFTRSKSDVM